VILAATVLAETACDLGYEVVQTQDYGPEARGGASRAEVIVSDVPVDFPEVERPELTLCLSQEGFERYAGQTRSGGLVLYDDGLVRPAGGAGEVRLLGLPFTALAAELTGTRITANMIALGAIDALLGLFGAEALARGLQARLPATAHEANLRALEAGRRRVG
jgi:2-oxoglutarate ferredoxin oxidoreductase subunit gamma